MRLQNGYITERNNSGKLHVAEKASDSNASLNYISFSLN